ncbi:hypothetical protein AXF42_Ash016457 [Apostasia shenzhenica]|uniref:Uncharacterized protein n=1 Tax=Apostasia shenzhenica TaxID=1088818 RepID=A0A2I0A073_9ASPA|nr:hypothetical protein AXF42_Ash016457 [Apostasia shenzhenica]
MPDDSPTNNFFSRDGESLPSVACKFKILTKFSALLGKLVGEFLLFFFLNIFAVQDTAGRHVAFTEIPSVSFAAHLCPHLAYIHPLQMPSPPSPYSSNAAADTNLYYHQWSPAVASTEDSSSQRLPLNEPDYYGWEHHPSLYAQPRNVNVASNQASVSHVVPRNIRLDTGGPSRTGFLIHSFVGTHGLLSGITDNNLGVENEVGDEDRRCGWEMARKGTVASEGDFGGCGGDFGAALHCSTSMTRFHKFPSLPVLPYSSRTQTNPNLYEILQQRHISNEHQTSFMGTWRSRGTRDLHIPVTVHSSFYISPSPNLFPSGREDIMSTGEQFQVFRRVHQFMPFTVHPFASAAAGFQRRHASQGQLPPARDESPPYRLPVGPFSDSQI